MAYEAKLPDGLPNLKIDTADERYKQLEALATSQKWTQEAFSSVLGTRRVMAAAPKAAPEPAPAANPDFSRMSNREKFAYALTHGSTPSTRGNDPHLTRKTPS